MLHVDVTQRMRYQLLKFRPDYIVCSHFILPSEMLLCFPDETAGGYGQLKCSYCSLTSSCRTSHNLLPLRLRCELALGACNGLAYLHELRIVHFDLKPDNLLLDGPPTLVRAAASAGTAPVQVMGLRGSSVATDASGLTAGGHGLPPMSSYGGSSICASSGMEPSHQQHYQQQPRVLGSTSRGGPGSVAGTVASINSSDGLLAAVAAGWAPAVKVADFGLSKHKLNNYVSSCRDLRGTLPYMAPELVADPERVSEKADVWSLGVVMWEMLTREMPYQVREMAR